MGFWSTAASFEDLSSFFPLIQAKLWLKVKLHCLYLRETTQQEKKILKFTIKQKPNRLPIKIKSVKLSTSNKGWILLFIFALNRGEIDWNKTKLIAYCVYMVVFVYVHACAIYWYLYFCYNPHTHSILHYLALKLCAAALYIV